VRPNLLTVLDELLQHRFQCRLPKTKGWSRCAVKPCFTAQGIFERKLYQTQPARFDSVLTINGQRWHLRPLSGQQP
jgi:hypothetical protein